MATAAARAGRNDRLAEWGQGLKRAAMRAASLAGGSALVAGSVAALVALVSYHPTDASFNTAAGGTPLNWMGSIGAWASDLLLTLFGPGAGLLLLPVALIGLRLLRGAPAGRWLRMLLMMAAGIVLAGTAATLLSGGAISGLPAGWGGAFGLALASLAELGFSAIGEPGIAEPFRIAVAVFAATAGLAFAWFGFGLTSEEKGWLAARRARGPTRAHASNRPARAAQHRHRRPQGARRPAPGARTAALARTWRQLYPPADRPAGSRAATAQC
jgi:DNA segregation ATPase FtsK/SpoIIIE, S-DNA-T family